MKTSLLDPCASYGLSKQHPLSELYLFWYLVVDWTRGGAAGYRMPWQAQRMPPSSRCALYSVL